jgi:hypothetical protein
MLRSFNKNSSRSLLTFLALTLATLPVSLSSQQRLALGLASLFGSTGPIVLAKLERHLNASTEENERGLERPLEHVQVLADTFKTRTAPLTVPVFSAEARSSQHVQVCSSQPNLNTSLVENERHLNALAVEIERDPWDDPSVQVAAKPVQVTLQNWMHIQ